MKYVSVSRAHEAVRHGDYLWVMGGIEQSFALYESTKHQTRIMQIRGFLHLRHAYLLSEQLVHVVGRTKLLSDMLLLLMRVYVRSLVVSDSFGFREVATTMRVFIFKLFAELNERTSADGGNLSTKAMTDPAHAALLAARGLLLELESHGLCNLADYGYNASEFAEDAYRFCIDHYADHNPRFVFKAISSLFRSLQGNSPAINAAKCYPEMPTPADSR